MPIPSVRTIDQDEVRNFGKINAEYEISGLTLIQTASYARFLQADRSSRDRLDIGLEAILREVFPIESYDSQFRLEYIRYELGKPRYTPEECRQLRLTYGMPFRVWLRLVKEQPNPERHSVSQTQLSALLRCVPRLAQFVPNVLKAKL